MQRKSWLLATACAGFVVLGCGDDDGGGGVSGGARVNDLTASERQSLCEDFAAKFTKLDRAIIKLDCTDDGLVAEDDEAGSCDDVRTECIADAEVEVEISCDDAPEEVTGGDECDATVAQFEACIDALVSMTEKLANDYTCETAEDFDDVEEPDLPKACTDLQDACPEAIQFME